MNSVRTTVRRRTVVFQVNGSPPLRCHTRSMVFSFVERELKFDIRPGFVVPELDALVPVGGQLTTTAEHLRSDYYDTDDHALLNAGITLRRRTGTSDTGWQLKVPHEPFREEIHADADGDTVPEELSRLLRGILRGRPPRHIAGLVTDRVALAIVDAEGRRLIEIDDDTVHATVVGADAAILTTWREIEIEAGETSDGTDDGAGAELDLLTSVARHLRRAGARPSKSTSKLRRAIQPVAKPRRSATAPSRPERARAGSVLEAYLEEQHRAILTGDLALRRDDASVIHKTRVATRRLRSTLRVFGPLFDPARAGELDADLRWFAAELGAVRDCQVLRARLDAMIDDIDESLLLGPVRARVDHELDRQQAEHWQRLQADLDSTRYLQLLANLATWATDPPLTSAAQRPAGSVTRYVARADRSVDRKLRRANRTGDVDLLHSARKSAKRARYAAEAASPVLGKRAAAKNAKRYQKLQDLLGEHQDSLVSAALLRRLGAVAGVTHGENGFAFGILHEREQDIARRVRRQAVKTAKRYA